MENTRDPLNGAKFIDGVAQVGETGVVGGGRNESDQTNNMTIVHREANRVQLVNGTGAQNIGVSGTEPIFLMGVNVKKALVGTLTITGGVDTAGAAANDVIPIGFVGTYGPSADALYLSGCTITKSSASDDGMVSVDFRPVS